MMRDLIAGAVRFSLVTWILCGIVYPLSVNGFAQAMFPAQANGSLIRASDGTIIGSYRIGQNWTDPRSFHGRPSATLGADPVNPDKTIATPYDASSSGGSNLGPTSRELWQRLMTDRKALDHEYPGLAGRRIPADLLTTSASGLDPDISIANAMLQAPRIAAARGVSEDKVRALINDHIVRRDLGVLGEPRVNVLELNLALQRPMP
jgi:potassium-transporting ATPase KdpC subunit